MTREEVIEKIVERVEDWELSQLIDYVQESIDEWASELSDEDLLDRYNEVLMPEDRITEIEKEGDDDGSDGS